MRCYLSGTTSAAQWTWVICARGQCWSRLKGDMPPVMCPLGGASERASQYWGSYVSNLPIIVYHMILLNRIESFLSLSSLSSSPSPSPPLLSFFSLSLESNFN